jgi:ribosomal protein S18 acetylase RimI-like enzyme
MNMAENDKGTHGLKLPDTVKIRPMRNDEWAMFHQIDCEIFEKEDQLQKEFFQERVKEPGFLALETKQEALIGYLVLGQFTEEIAHLGRIGVQKAEQSHGYGSTLMEYAIDWFMKRKGVNEIQLYTQVDNVHAQGLYKKYGFKVIGQTWHYFIPFDILHATGEYLIQIAQPEEYKTIADLFPSSLPTGAIRRFIEREQYIHTLKDHFGHILGASRFTPNFPGCFPFELLTLSAFDDYILAFQPLCDPPSEILRITFHNNKQLAILCETRGYHLHHKLFRMQLHLKK